MLLANTTRASHNVQGKVTGGEGPCTYRHVLRVTLTAAGNLDPIDLPNFRTQLFQLFEGCAFRGRASSSVSEGVGDGSPLLSLL